jgi:hypothetical protein
MNACSADRNACRADVDARQTALGTGLSKKSSLSSATL